MKTRTLETPDCKIVWRLPNVIERMDLFADLGIEIQGGKVQLDDGKQYTMFTKALKLCERFVQSLELKVDDRVISTWAEAVEEDSFFEPLSKLANELMLTLANIGAGKNAAPRT